MRRTVRICYAGSYERNYPRNRLVIRALRAAGARVEEAHVPVFERVRDKSGLGMPGALLVGLRLLAAYVRLAPETALRLLRCDALAVGYIGQLDMLVLGSVARLLGRPVIFNPLVTLTDTLVDDRAIVATGSLPARLVELVDRLSLRLATTVLVDTEETGRFIHERFGVPRSAVVVVPASAEESVFHPSAEPAPSGGPLDVVFIGTFIPLHGIATILRAVALLEARGAPVRVELVGTGQTYQQMRALAEQLAIRPSTLTWTDWLPYAQLGARLRRADVALGVFDAGAKAARVVPNKVYQSLACGVATVTRSCPPAEALLRDGEDALLVPPADPAALADAITRLCDAAERARIARNGYAAFQKHASEAALADALQPLVQSLGKRGR
ncbi:MAG: glycosyl transferase family 1 [Chloroflexi bacterium]|nr:MAG: glycosyl transferase family 1 [Chloroflexota bacterium]